MGLHELIHTKNYEKVIAKVRRHFFTFIPTLAFFLLLALVPLGIHFLLKNIFPNAISNQAVYAALVLGGSLYYLGLCVFLYTAFVEFHLDLNIITNDRIVDINQITLFARKIVEVDLYQIQDVSSEVKGFWATLFQYGTVEVQTAGSIPKFVMENIPNPHRIRHLLLVLAAEDKKSHRANS